MDKFKNHMKTEQNKRVLKYIDSKLNEQLLEEKPLDWTTLPKDILDFFTKIDIDIDWKKTGTTNKGINIYTDGNLSKKNLSILVKAPKFLEIFSSMGDTILLFKKG